MSTNGYTYLDFAAHPWCLTYPGGTRYLTSRELARADARVVGSGAWAIHNLQGTQWVTVETSESAKCPPAK